MRTTRWSPVAVLAAGLLLVGAARTPRRMELRAPLSALPASLGELRAEEMALGAEVRAGAAPDEYLLRVYRRSGEQGVHASVYVGYYGSQSRGRTIHSPRNCLPGNGWEPLAARSETIATGAGPVEVSHRLLQRGATRAVVLYWYQGRGRVESSELRVKWDLLRDMALRRRSDEALVRIVVPVRGDETEANRLAGELARQLVPALTGTLPT